MREILFKAKRMDNGEWVEGIPIKTHIELFMCFEENPHYCNQYGYMEIDEIVLVDENTLCQYTGLTDKNGNKIWENDVIKHYNKIGIGEPDKYLIASIQWQHDNARFVQNAEDGMYAIIGSNNYEVIGNIFDGEFQNDSEGTKKD